MLILSLAQKVLLSWVEVERLAHHDDISGLRCSYQLLKLFDFAIVPIKNIHYIFFVVRLSLKTDPNKLLRVLKQAFPKTRWIIVQEIFVRIVWGSSKLLLHKIDKPKIDPNNLGDQRDVDCIIAVMKKAVEFSETPTMKELYLGVALPSKLLEKHEGECTDASWEEYTRTYGSTLYHDYTLTCAIGKVVDSSLSWVSKGCALRLPVCFRQVLVATSSMRRASW